MKKMTKSPENTEVTPSKKKLKQARLPFALISDVSPKSDAPQSRKRKLSVPEAEPVTKLGKISKENGVTDDSIIISDDDSKGIPSPEKQDKPLNPFVKLVDTAWKKKIQKSKGKKKAKTRSSKRLTKGNVEKQPSQDKEQSMECDDVEMVEVDVLIHEDGDQNTTNNTENVSNEEVPGNKETESTPKHSPKTKDKLDDSSLDTSTLNSELNESTVSNPTTPKQKRSSRTKDKLDDSNLDISIVNSELNESMASNPSSPKNNKSISDSNKADKSLNESVKSTILTPKQLQKKLESAKKREEREKEKQEREKKRQQEKEERAKKKQELEEQKKREREEKEEAKKKEREEKEELKRKEREEKEKQRELEKKVRELKEEQRRKEKEDKEEQRKREKEAREEERRKKQEALELEKQEQELKKKKAAEAFVNFFVPKQKVEKEPVAGPVSKSTMLSSFAIKADMRLAPTCRNEISEERKEQLEKMIVEQNKLEKLYLKSLKDGSAKPLSSGKTWPLDDKDDVIIVEDELPPIDGAGEVITCESAPREKLRPKLLSFHENRRPPYWGTWRKKSAFVKPRRPFGQDGKQLDYEVDSDDDWEDEGDGESLDGSAGGSDDEAGADDYEVDNEVFVPHGYLSDEEATMDEEDRDDVLSLSPETQKARLKHLEDEFESEMKKPTEKLKPRLYGLLWETSDGGKPDNCVDALWNYFEKFSMIMDDPTPLLQPAPEPEVSVTEKKKSKKKKTAEGETSEQSPKSDKKKKAKTENNESKPKKPKAEVKKIVPNQPGINSFLKKVNT